MPRWRVEHLDGAFAKIGAGEFGSATDTVAALTERPPRSIGHFVGDRVEAFTAVVRPA